MSVKTETFTFEHAGKPHSGTFTIQSKMIHVSTAWGKKAAELGGVPALTMARMVARELIQDRQLATR